MIERYFTKDIGNDTVEDFFNWKEVDVCIKDGKGQVIFEQKGCEFPEHYSQTACDIIASKYFYRGAGESSLKEVVSRMADFWGHILGHILYDREVLIFKDEIKYLLYSQMWAPNSPQWFNAGVVYSYLDKGARTDEGLYYYDAGTREVEPVEETDFRAPTSACFILSIEDKLIGKNSITDHYVTETKLFKSGSGCGTNFSPLRAEGEKLSSGGTSSGLMSYLKGLDVNAGTIKSGGTTRRAAKMVIVDVNHPEIEEFIDWKVKEEEKAKALIKAGYDGSIGGEAYSTVSGQNSNNSVRIPSYFMNGLGLTKHYLLSGRVDPEVNRYVAVDDIFHKIAKAAWECGDPGIQFSDTINKWNTCQTSGKINASNPCGEFVFLDNTACNLSSINLEKFFTKDTIDLDGFYHAIRLAQLAMEASVEGGAYPTEEIAENSYMFRPTGLGITGLAGMLENMGLAYDSKEAREWAAAICSYMTAASYEMSAEMAIGLEPFEKYYENKMAMREVLQDHAAQAWKLENSSGNENLRFLKERAVAKWGGVLRKDCEEAGFRNAQVTCIAPTGTISLAMDASSTGVEPYFSRKTIKKLADGSTIEQRIDAIKTADEIDPLDHVRMVAAIQPHISGAISKTVNMPEESTVEDIENVYKQAYLMGCKSITVYRDGSKGTQVLETNEEVTDIGAKIDKKIKDMERLEAVISEYEKKLAETNKPVVLLDPDESETFGVDTICGVIYDRESEARREEREEMEAEETKEKKYNGIAEFLEAKKNKEAEDEDLKSLNEIMKEFRGHIAVVPVEKEKPFERKKPEGIRMSRTHNAKIGDIQLYITVGYYEDGKVAEIFVNTDRQGEVVNGLLASLSKVISHLLQYGVEPGEISKILRCQKFEPAGLVERHPYIKMTSSISDLIAKVLEFETYDFSRLEIKPDLLGMEIAKERAEKRSGDYLKNADVMTKEEFENLDQKEWYEKWCENHKEALESEKMRDCDEDGVAYWEKWEDENGVDNPFKAFADGEKVYGEVCSNCGSSDLVVSGTCKTCLVCGTTTGCG